MTLTVEKVLAIVEACGIEATLSARSTDSRAQWELAYAKALHREIIAICEQERAELGGCGQPEIARIMRTIRKRMGLTQAAFARLVGCALNTVSRYERGEIKPGVCTLLRLRKYAETDAEKSVVRDALAALGVPEGDL